MISQNTSKPFNTKLKDIFASLVEVNADYELTEEQVFVGQMPDFYNNVEMAVLTEIASKEYNN